RRPASCLACTGKNPEEPPPLPHGSPQKYQIPEYTPEAPSISSPFPPVLLTDCTEVPKQLMPVLRQHSLRVELDAEDGRLPVSYAHDRAVLASRIHPETFGQCLRISLQGVVAGHPVLPGQPCKNPPILASDLRDLSMHGLLSFFHVSAECMADDLVPQA